MKKSFKMTHPKKAPDRHIEAIKHELNKYISRERNKKLPEGIDFWDFDCKFGDTAETARTIHLTEISKCIDAQKSKTKDEFYIEILVKHGIRKRKDKVKSEEPA